MALPGNLTTREVKGQYINLAGTYLTGQVEFSISTVLTNPSADVVIVPSVIIAELDSEGRFSVMLVTTDDADLSPVGFRYKVVEKFSGAVGRAPFYLDVPGNSAVPIDLADVVPLTVPSEGATNYATLTALQAEEAARIQADTAPVPWTVPFAFPDSVIADSLYTGTAPVVTTAQTTAPTSGYIKHSPDPVALSGSDVRGRFQYVGAGGFQAGASFPDTSYVLPTSRYPNTYSSGQAHWGIEFMTNAAIFQVRFKYISTATMYRLSIDGRKVKDLMQSVGGFNSGSGHMMTVDLGSSAIRRIRLDFRTLPFGGIYIPPTASLWQPPTRGGRFMGLGDSITDGSDENTGSGQGTWFRRTARLIGSTDDWQQGRGGTGYVSPGTNPVYAKFQDRLTLDVDPYPPDRMIIWGGYNDSGGLQSDIATAAKLLYSTIKTNHPDCKILVVGCWSPDAVPAASHVNTDNTLKAAAAAAELPFVSPITGEVYATNGALVASQGPWITSANRAGFIGSDAVHPNDAGHVYLSRRIFDAIVATDGLM